MTTYLIGYELFKDRVRSAQLIEKIKTLGVWWHCLKSNWIVKSHLSAAQIKEVLRPLVEETDDVLILELTGDAAWIGLSDACALWIKNDTPNLEELAQI